MAKHNIYSVFDKISKDVMYLGDAPNHGLFIRSQVPTLSKMVPLGDIEIYHVGYLNKETKEIEPIPPVLVSWDEYKHPVSPFAHADVNSENKEEKVADSKN